MNIERWESVLEQNEAMVNSESIRAWCLVVASEREPPENGCTERASAAWMMHTKRARPRPIERNILSFAHRTRARTTVSAQE